MKKIKAIEKKSRGVFHKLHVGHNNDEAIFRRLASMMTTEYLKVPKDFFKGKICLDAGCGSNANSTYAMLSQGAKKVYAFDLDKTVYTADARLKQFSPRYELSIGSVLDIDFPDETFDFVHCAGVLHHTIDQHKGLKELARVTKRGGTMYINVHGKGGIMRDFMKVLREKYAKEKDFRKFVDSLSAETMFSLWKWIEKEMKAHGDDPSVPAAIIKSLFNEDLALTIKDRIQAPLYKQNTEAELVAWFKKNGFTKIERLKKYPKQNNIRRFLAPMYNDYDHPLARLLYGEGEPQIKAIKK